MLQLREYQQRILEDLTAFLQAAGRQGAKRAFIERTDRPYRAVAKLPELPYVCLRVPTGGGKTLLASHSLGLIAKDFLNSDRALCLWLVPTNAIREQTLNALRDRKHPYRQALESRFAGPVTVIDLTEALYIQYGTLAGETCVIVATLAALRVEDTEGRKVYESNGALQHHFSDLNAPLASVLERNTDGSLPYSLANVLRIHRPVVIMDEAHNARTQLSFDTLARFNPSFVLEFTATPETVHQPEKGKFASNILCHVSAAELKAEEMVKLPIRLETRPEWTEVVSEALAQRQHLEELATEEEQESGEYIRPIILFQAQPKSSTKSTITAEVLKQNLIDNFKVAEDQIAIATGGTRELEDVNLFERSCPIRFIITVAALKEGWDCSFAYVLCSIAEIGSAKAVEQILGRVLRLPHAKQKTRPQLNCAYAFCASKKFQEAALSLRDALVENGFERLEAELLITQFEREKPLEYSGSFPVGLLSEVTETVSEVPRLELLPIQLQDRITYDEPTGVLAISGIVTSSDRDEITKCFKTSEGRQVAERLFQKSRGRSIAAQSGPIRPNSFAVPYLAIREDGRLKMFDEDQLLDATWKLSACDANLSEDLLSSSVNQGTIGQLDVSSDGKIEYEFVEKVRKQLQLVGFEPGWDHSGLVNWLDRQIPHPDVTRLEATLFISKLLSNLMEMRSVTLDQLAQQKYRLRDAITARIDEHRKAFAKTAYQRQLFGADASKVEVSPAFCFHFEHGKYSPNWLYEGRYKFKKHLFPEVGELKSEGEEFECAMFLDQLDEVSYWVRNLERRHESSFWLQTSTDRFYPDFVALLEGGRILVVEYKGKHLMTSDDTKEKTTIGDLWASRSNGHCLFVMATENRLDEISKLIKKKPAKQS